MYRIEKTALFALLLLTLSGCWRKKQVELPVQEEQEEMVLENESREPMEPMYRDRVSGPEGVFNK